MRVFLESNQYDNKFAAVYAMSEIYLYAQKQEVELCWISYRSGESKM